MQKVSLGNGLYKSLIESKFPEFNYSIVILDGDARSEFRRATNPKVAYLPGTIRPENVIYQFLSDLDEGEEFWSDEIGGYSKQVFLNNKPQLQHLNNRELMKTWFNSELRHWGKNGSRLFKSWKLKNEQSIKKFNEEIEKLVNKIKP